MAIISASRRTFVELETAAESSLIPLVFLLLLKEKAFQKT